MRKTTTLKTLAAAALSLLAASCAKEQLTDNGGQAGVSFTLEVPGAPATKAIGDGTTAKTLYYQVFDEQGNTVGLDAQTTKFGTDGKAKVNFQLVKDQTYNFIFWAQTSEAGYYTIADNDLRTITANYSGKKSNDENFDAFFAVEKALKISGPVTKDITLKRPFAQINIGTKGTITAGTASRPIEFTDATSTVTVTGIPTVFSPLANADAQLGTPADVTFDTADAPAGNITVNGTDYTLLAMNYVFASETGDVTDITATLTVENKKVPLSVPNAPIKRNWRTNIVGNLLTAEAGFDIVIDPNFDDDEDIDLENIKNEASLIALFANGGTAKLVADIEITKALELASGKEIVLDLNGKTIKNMTAGLTDRPAIVVSGELTIKGDGIVDGGEGGNNVTVCARTGGKVTINGGNYTVGGDASNQANSCIYTQGGDIIINGGYFRSKCPWNGRYYVLNQNNSDPGTITVNGGQFENYDPTTGDDNLGGNFVADGYTTTASYEENTGNVVYKVVKATVTASTEDELKSAMTKDGSIGLVNQAIELSSAHLSSKKKTTLTIDKAGSISPAATFRTDDSESIFVGASILTLNGTGTLVGPSNSTAGNGSQAIFVQGGTVNIYGNLNIEGGSGSVGNHALAITNGTANIYGGYFHSGLDKDGKSSDVIYLRPQSKFQSAKCNIYGGVFETDGDPSFLLNIQAAGAKWSTLKVYGGTFVGFNPADNGADGEHTNYVADGYKSVETTYNGKQAWKVEKE